MNEQMLSRVLAEVTLCALPEHGIDTTGWSHPAGKLVPDDTKGYVQFKLGGAWPGRTAYGTALHPAVAAASHASLLHQNLNDRHRLAVHSDVAQARNHFIGAVVALDYPREPYGGWKMTADPKSAPIITAAGTLFKQASEVPDILKEHLGGIHKWSVSQELYHQRSASGFVVETAGQKLKKSAADLCAAHTPADFGPLGLAYVPWADAPEDLLKCYDEEGGMVAADWQGCRVTVLCGGLNGRVHWGAAALVPYGAEKEAEVLRLLAAAPADFTAYNNFLLQARKSVDELRRLCLADR